MFFRKKKIPCYVMVFDQVEIIQKSLAFLSGYTDRIDLIIIENPSPNTPQIKKVIDRYGASGHIKRHYCFEENITTNAYEIALHQELKTIKQSPYVLVTDGDITSEDAGWLDEELNVLKQHHDVFACGVTLDKSNLPLKTIPSAKNFIPPDKHVYDDFIEANTGVHLLMFRGPELYTFTRWREKHTIHFVDGQTQTYCYEQLHKKWARTKKSTAYHLTWDLYNDLDHPYTKMKLNKSFADTWFHERTSPYTVTNY